MLDLGTIIAGPYVGSLLADLGADVIKVERPPLGDEFRVAHGGRGGSSFEVYNRDQRSALLNLSPGDDRLVFDRLVGSADVVVDNYRAGVASRLGIAHDQLAAVNPQVVTVSISAFGETGPLGRRPGFDPVIQAMSGIMRAQGGPDQADSPAFLTVPINDVLAAGLATLGACAALLARARLGQGQHVGVTLSRLLLPAPVRVPDPGRRQRRLPGGRPGLRRARAARPALPGRRRLGQARRVTRPAPGAGGGRAGPGPGRVEAGAESGAGSGAEALAAGIAALLAGLPAAEVVARAHAAGVPAVRARQARELTADAQLIRHGLLTVLDSDDRGARQVDPGRWLQMPGLPAREPGKAPGGGEHTELIRREAGLGS